MFARLMWTLLSIIASPHDDVKPKFHYKHREPQRLRHSEYQLCIQTSPLHSCRIFDHPDYKPPKPTMPHSKTPGQSNAASDKFNKDQAEGMSLCPSLLRHHRR